MISPARLFFGWRSRCLAGLALFCLLLCSIGQAAANRENDASADADWRAILALDAGPSEPTEGVHTRQAALALARQHLDRQEAALRNFPLAHPDDPRRFAAKVRLADVLFARANLLQETAAREKARRLLDEVEADPVASTADHAAAAYSRVSQAMQELGASSALRLSPAQLATGRETLTQAIRAFERTYPADLRLPALLVELATLYDGAPAQKKALLDEALSHLPTSDNANADNLRMRVADDLRRLALFGKPLDFRLPPVVSGRPAAPDGSGVVEMLASHRGRCVVVLFWATWSAPSLAELTRLQEIATHCDPRQVEFLTVSLDQDRAALAEAVRQLHITWPVFCDGRGWSGETVRSLGLNALPTTWVLAADGTLTTLNARGSEEESIRRALSRQMPGSR